MYVFLADVVATLHAAYVFVVVFGLLLTLLGRAMGWRWVSNRWWRSVHLTMIALVVLRASLGEFDPKWRSCPLTWWEKDLRKAGGQVDADGEVTYEGSDVGKFMHDLIHPDQGRVPAWVLLPVYAVFGLLVIGSLWLVPVRWRNAPADEGATGMTLAPGDRAI